MTTEAIGLAKTIAGLREELVKANKQGNGEELRFKVDEIELEVAVEISGEGSTAGKASFKVLGIGAEVGAEGKLGRSDTNRVIVKLKPAADFHVSGEVEEKPK